MLLHHTCIFYVFALYLLGRGKFFRLLFACLVGLCFCVTRPEGGDDLLVVALGELVMDLAVDGSGMAHFGGLSGVGEMGGFHELIAWF